MLRKQTFKDFELILYHDGPVVGDIPDLPKDLNIRWVVSEKRYNDWGHSLRDKGMRIAKGEWIIHTNPDNLLNPILLACLNEASERYTYCDYFTYGIKLMGATGIFTGKNNGFSYVDGKRDPHNYVYLVPEIPVFQRIDAMQLVMKREKWIEFGGWYDKSEQSDGILYEKIGKTYKGMLINKILGEHY